jgi:RimJ/RimL family protein N-acetyltransferase
MRHPLTDGIVTIRAPRDGDAEVLVAGRDERFRRYLGSGDPDPRPFACVEVEGKVVGWVDYDADRTWLEPGEVNVGYNVFAPYRGRGYATRALQLLLRHLATVPDVQTATLLIHAQNERSIALGIRAGFASRPDLDGNRYLGRPVRP